MENPYRSLSKINPQKEGHHREIANDVFDALVSARLSGGEYQVALSIIERTWGHPHQTAGQSHSRTISLGYFEKATNLSRQGVIDAVSNLEKKRVIAVKRSGTKGTEYLFNKHYDTWLVNPTLLVDDVSLVKQTLPSWSSRVDQSSQAELTRASQVLVPSTEPTIESIESIERVEREEKQEIAAKKEKAKSPERKRLEFEDYIEELRPQFSDLDYELELRKFRLYWSEGSRKLQRPKLALLNWMTKAREYKKEKGGQSGAHQRSSRRLPAKYRSPEEIFGDRDG